MRLADKSLIIIGGTTGIGLSAAKAFVAEGARIVIVGRKPESVEAAQRDIGETARALVGDACDPTTASRAIETALREFGAFHGLYHVAGGSGRRQGDGPLEKFAGRCAGVGR